MSPARPVPRSVLVVDDDTQISQLICAALILRGCRPVSVGTFGAALVEVCRGQCETVLLDLSLPDSHPTETLKSITYLKDRGAGRVIVITGMEVTRYLRDFAIASGADGIISKTDADVIAKIKAIAEDVGHQA